MIQVSQSKLEKLRSKMEDSIKKRDQLDKSIKKLQTQIAEEESKGFRSVIEEVGISYEDAIKLLKDRSISTPSVGHDVTQQEESDLSMKENSYETI